MVERPASVVDVVVRATHVQRATDDALADAIDTDDDAVTHDALRDADR